jgi:hypothetical protein
MNKKENGCGKKKKNEKKLRDNVLYNSKIKR